jgi:broad specificity phosphatase PhoE
LKGKAGDYYLGESVPGDEPVSAFDSRVVEAFDFCIQNKANKKAIAIVTHGNVTRSIYRNILNVLGKIKLDLLALTVMNYTGADVEIESNEGVTISE